MRVVIVGLAKSGTTAMLYKVANSLNNPVVLMEPVRPWKERSWRRKNRVGQDAVAKLLIGKLAPNSIAWSYDDSKPLEITPLDYGSFGYFEKKVFIVRDPRDIIVSHMLHRAQSYVGSDSGIRKYLDLLMEKELAPQSKSILPLVLPVLDMAYLQYVFDAGIAFVTEHTDYFVITYEDFIAGNLASLEIYLGMNLTGSATVDSKWRHLARTKSSGSWRKWFSPEDAAFFKPMLTPYMSAFGYDSEDWEIGKDESIPPSEGSEYVKRWLVGNTAV